jgi:hypothetical protein
MAYYVVGSSPEYFIDTGTRRIVQLDVKVGPLESHTDADRHRQALPREAAETDAVLRSVGSRGTPITYRVMTTEELEAIRSSGVVVSGFRR